MQIISGIVKEHGPKLNDDLLMDVLLEDSEEALKDIAKYQSHLIKTYISNRMWQNEFDSFVKTRCWLVADWAMKL